MGTTEKLFHSTFGKWDSKIEDAQACIVQVPIDNSSDFQHGTHKGPQSILKASQHLETFDVELKKDLNELKVHTKHLKNIPSTNSEALENLDEAFKDLPTDIWPIFIGGEQTLTRSTVKYAFKNAEDPSQISVLYLDAHADSKNSFRGTNLSHRCTLKSLSEKCSSIVLAGLRNMSEDESFFLRTRAEAISHFSIHDLRDQSKVSELIQKLKKHVYISIDMSVLDPSECPGVSHPEPLGLKFEELQLFLKSIFQSRNVIGADICEICPLPGDQRSEYLAAKLVQKLLAYKFLL